MKKVTLFFIIVIAGSLLHNPSAVFAQEKLPDYLQDRGTGVPSSMFGTFIPHRALITYLYFEYYLDHDMEYKPAELGYGLDRDYRGKFNAAEGLLSIGYGLISLSLA